MRPSEKILATPLQGTTEEPFTLRDTTTDSLALGTCVPFRTGANVVHASSRPH